MNKSSFYGEGAKLPGGIDLAGSYPLDYRALINSWDSHEETLVVEGAETTITVYDIDSIMMDALYTGMIVSDSTGIVKVLEDIPSGATLPHECTWKEVGSNNANDGVFYLSAGGQSIPGIMDGSPGEEEADFSANTPDNVWYDIPLATNSNAENAKFGVLLVDTTEKEIKDKSIISLTVENGVLKFNSIVYPLITITPVKLYGISNKLPVHVDFRGQVLATKMNNYSGAFDIYKAKFKGANLEDCTPYSQEQEWTQYGDGSTKKDITSFELSITAASGDNRDPNKLYSGGNNGTTALTPISLAALQKNNKDVETTSISSTCSTVNRYLPIYTYHTVVSLSDIDNLFTNRDYTLDSNDLPVQNGHKLYNEIFTLASEPGNTCLFSNANFYNYISLTNSKLMETPLKIPAEESSHTKRSNIYLYIHIPEPTEPGKDNDHVFVNYTYLETSNSTGYREQNINSNSGKTLNIFGYEYSVFKLNDSFTTPQVIKFSTILYDIQQTLE